MRVLAAVIVLISAASVPARAEPAAPAPARPAPPRASPPRLVLVAPPAVLEAAVRTALAPWHVVIVIEPAPPPADINGATEVADRQRANAVAWLVPRQMVVFERSTADLVRRPVPGDDRARLDDASAAALALSLKTLMRLPDQPPPEEPALVVAAPTPPAAPMRWRLAVAAGLREHVTGGVEPRATLSVERALGPLAVAVTASLGAGLGVEQQGFTGTWRDLAVGAAVRVPLVRGAWRLGPGLGLSVHRTTLDGSFNGNSGNGNTGDRTAAETNLGFDADGAASWTRGHLGAGLRVGGSFVPYRDSFTIKNQEVFEVSPWELELALEGIVVF